MIFFRAVQIPISLPLLFKWYHLQTEIMVVYIVVDGGNCIMIGLGDRREIKM